MDIIYLYSRNLIIATNSSPENGLRISWSKRTMQSTETRFSSPELLIDLAITIAA